MAHDKFENGAQCCFTKFDWRLFISMFCVKAVWIILVYFTLSHFNKSTPTLLQVLQPCGWRCVECAIHHECNVGRLYGRVSQTVWYARCFCSFTEKENILFLLIEFC